MGKVEDMRAMREARYEATQKAAPKPKGVKGTHVPLDTVSCGHRSISGGFCIRPKDHSEKSHRYKKLEG